MTTPDVLLQQLQAWTEGRLSARQTQQFLSGLLAQPVWFPGTRQTWPGPSAQVIQRLHLSPGPQGGLPTLPVWFENPARFDLPETAALLQYPAHTLLVLVLTQRFNARIGHRQRQCLLLYDDLLNLRSLMLLKRLAEGHTIERMPAPNVSALVPALLAHCRSRPAVRRAWLAVVSSSVGHQVVAMLDVPSNAEPEVQALERRLDPLLPPGVSMNVVDAAGDFHAEIRQAIGHFKPLHKAGRALHWQGLDRLRQWVSPARVPVVALDIGPERRPD